MRNPSKELSSRRFPTSSATLARGDVDVVFNNAGYGMAGRLEGVTDEQMLRIIHTNLMGPIRVTKTFTPRFREKGGLFINPTSIGHAQVPPKVEYHLTKWGQSLCPALDELLTWAERQPSSPSGSQTAKATRSSRG
jgi:NAD(P)-dependent dehydrogenase (short-subunit alcohol dehydrogenase family)